jgi:hypothetical protein
MEVQLPSEAEVLRILNELKPVVRDRVMEERRIDAIHRRRLAWVCLWCAFVAFLALAGIAAYAIHEHAAADAALIFGSGAGCIAGIFVTHRFTR